VVLQSLENKTVQSNLGTGRIAWVDFYGSETFRIPIQGGPKKLYIFQHTIPLEPFKIKWC